MHPLGVVLLFLPFLQTLRAEDHLVQHLSAAFDDCLRQPEALKCLKIGALQLVERALHLRALDLLAGVALVGEPAARRLNATRLRALDDAALDALLAADAGRLLAGRKLRIDLPRLVAGGMEEEEEGRKRKNKHGGAALLWALAIKGSFLAMAYKGIAIMAGTALIVGKMALLLSAILGLKKLVSGGHEKTTFEIVKHPKYSESHTHSTSYEDEGHYRRAFDQAYAAHAPALL